MIVSIAGMRDSSDIRRKDELRERRWIGRKAQDMPTGPKARAVERWTENRWSVRVHSSRMLDWVDVRVPEWLA